MKTAVRLLVVCVVLLGITYVFARSFTRADAPSFEKADRYLAGYVDDGRLPGAVALIARQGEVVLHEAYGVRTLEPATPMTRETIFRLASMTKPIVSVAALQLIERGALGLDDPVSKYIPAFADMAVYVSETEREPLTHPITVKHLLTHTGGLASGLFQTPVDDRYRASEALNGSTDLASLADALTNLPLAHQPGARWTYSHSVDVMGRLIEITSGMPLAGYLQTHVLDPLQMVDTTFDVPEAERDRLATLYIADAQDVLHPRPYTRSYPRGNTGLYGTASDYFRFAQMLLNRGTLDGKQILKPETVDLLMRNHLPEALIPIQAGPLPLKGNGFGLGMGVQVATGPTSAGPAPGTNWWIGASGTYFWVDRENEMAVILLTQVANPARYPFLIEYPAVVFGALAG